MKDTFKLPRWKLRKLGKLQATECSCTVQKSKFNCRICHTYSCLKQESRSRHLFLRWYKVKKGTSGTAELQSNTSYYCIFLWLVSPPTSSTELTVFTLSISLQLSSAFRSCFVFLMLKTSWRLKKHTENNNNNFGGYIFPQWC